MQNVPYAICRLDSAGSGVVGYLIISPYYVELQRLDSDKIQRMEPSESITSRLWQELPLIGRDETPRPLRRDMGEETFLLADELARESAFLLAVESITLAAPRFAADRLSVRLQEWVEAERAGAPMCPFKCCFCGDRLEKTDTLAASDPGEVRGLGYSCREHESQEARYSPASKAWTDARI